MSFVRRFLKDESGATAIEYGLIAGLISLVIIGGAGLAGNSVSNMFNTVSNSLNNAAANGS